jgi:hypothetical protein
VETEKYAIQLELKYCERCGALWLRPKSSDLIFCAACVKATSTVLTACPREATPVQKGRFDSTQGPTFWGEGGNA